MTQPYPAALVISSLESVSNDNNVLYRLVRPLADGSGVESTDRLVNVVPHRRTYCFERKEQLDTFSDEILKRPLVIQPVLHFGRGIGPFCGACYDDEPWVVMINQTHPKILGRLQMGLELARSAVSKGQSVEIKFRFGKLIERVYREHLQQKEMCEAESMTGIKRALARTLLQFRYIEWDHGDLTLRSHGLAAKLKTSTLLMLEMENIEKVWDFEDVGMHDMMWNQWQPELKYLRPNLSHVSEDEIRTMLPGWTVNAVTPLEAIGEIAPARTYSYAQAGRLYASFRKVRKSHDADSYQNRPSNGEINSNHYYTQSQNFETTPAHWNPQAMSDHWAPSGAEAMPDHWTPSRDEAMPDHWTPSRDEAMPDHCTPSRDEAMPDHWALSGAEAMPDHWAPSRAEALPDQRALGHHSAETNLKTATAEMQTNDPMEIPQRDFCQNLYGNSKFNYTIEGSTDQVKRHMSKFACTDKYGHIVPQVLIQQPGKPLDSLHHLKKQDSDRSSRSTNADSGYCPSADDYGQRSRGGSYDLNDDISNSKGLSSPSFANQKNQSRSQDYLCDPSLNGHYSFTNNLSNGHGMGGGVENPAFTRSIDKDLNSDKALESHRQFVRRISTEVPNVNHHATVLNNSCEGSVFPKQYQTRSGSVSSLDKIAESFI